MRITNPKIVICEASNIDRVRQSFVQLGLDIPVYIFDDSRTDNSVNELLVETGNEIDFR